MVKKGLGKGLGALLKEDNIFSKSDEKDIVLEIDINKIEPYKNQPRQNFDKETLEELASSIKSVGIINPIIVKKKGEFYEIISGERRWRASRIAGLKKVPVIAREYTDAQKMQVALIENIQRENLNPLEEAVTYQKLQQEFGLSQEKIAEKVGKSRAAVANSIRLLNLDQRVQNFITEEKLTAGHSRTLLSIQDKEMQFELAENIIEQSLSVRQTEDFVKKFLEETERSKTLKNPLDDVQEKSAKKEIYEHLKSELNQILGTKVNIKDGKNKGKIEIEYYSEEELDRIICLLKNKLGS